MRAGAEGDTETSDPIPPTQEHDSVILKVDQLADDLKNKLINESDDLQLISGISKFVERYLNLSGSKRSQARLASALHMFGSSAGAAHSTRSTPLLRHGKRIPVQATAAGRRRKGITRGKGKIFVVLVAGLLFTATPIIYYSLFEIYDSSINCKYFTST